MSKNRPEITFKAKLQSFKYLIFETRMTEDIVENLALCASFYDSSLGYYISGEQKHIDTKHINTEYYDANADSILGCLLGNRVYLSFRYFQLSESEKKETSRELGIISQHYDDDHTSLTIIDSGDFEKSYKLVTQNPHRYYIMRKTEQIKFSYCNIYDNDYNYGDMLEFIVSYCLIDDETG
jgi:hypothetical protein